MFHFVIAVDGAIHVLAGGGGGGGVFHDTRIKDNRMHTV